MSMFKTGTVATLVFSLLAALGGNTVEARFFQHASLEVHSPPEPTPELTVTMPAAMVKVQQIISGIEKQPTCKRIASKKLLQSCASYDGRDAADSTTDEALEKFQRLFAIRQTACELEEAQQEMPSACSPLLHPDRPDTRYTNDCLNALFEGNNHWTTFTGLKNQALITCHAMRSEADKEESLHVMKVLLHSVTDINGQLVLSKDQLEKLFKDLSEVQHGMQGFYQDLHNDSKQVQATVQELFLNMQNKMSATHGEIGALQDTMNAAALQFQEYSNDIKAAFERTSALGTDVTTWSEGMSKLQEEVADMQSKHQYQLAMVMDEFAQKVYATTNSVELANNMTSAMAQKIAQLNNEIGIPVGKISNLNSGMDDLAEQQQYMQEMQIQTQRLAGQTKDVMDETFHSITQLAEATKEISTFVGSIFGHFAPSAAFAAWWIVAASVVCAWCHTLGCSLIGSLIAGLGIGSGIAVVLKSILSPVDIVGAIIDYHPRLSGDLAQHGSIAVVLCTGILIGAMGSWFCRRLLPRQQQVGDIEEDLYDPASPSFDYEAGKSMNQA